MGIAVFRQSAVVGGIPILPDSYSKAPYRVMRPISSESCHTRAFFPTVY